MLKTFLEVLIGIIIAAIFVAGIIAWAEQVETWCRALAKRWKAFKNRHNK